MKRTFFYTLIIMLPIALLTRIPLARESGLSDILFLTGGFAMGVLIAKEKKTVPCHRCGETVDLHEIVEQIGEVVIDGCENCVGKGERHETL